MLASGRYKLVIWLVCDQTRLRIGRNTVVLSDFVGLSINRLLPRMIRDESRTNSGMPTIRDQTARLRLPIKISSNISAITMIETNIITLMIPKNVRTIIHICSVSLVSSGLSKADNLSKKESPLMRRAATFI